MKIIIFAILGYFLYRLMTKSKTLPHQQQEKISRQEKNNRDIEYTDYEEIE